MLSSITPLGERGRGNAWWLTASWFAAGALLAGAAGGALTGLAGRLLPGWGWRGILAGVVLALAVAFDLGPLQGRLPSSRRQVNEDWLSGFRGWVYGLGYGAQLGVGLATIVTSAAVPAAAALCLLGGSGGGGALIGGTFGAIRAASLLPARSVGDPAALAALHRRLAGAEALARRAAQGLVVAAAVAGGGFLL